MEWTDRVKEIIDSKRLKQVELCRRTGFSESYISRFLNGGIAQDSLSAALKLSKALGVSLRFLAEGIEDGPGPQPELKVEFVHSLERFHGSHPLSTQHYIPVRLMKDHVAAGVPTEINEDDIQGWVLIYNSREWMPHAPENYTCIHVKGESMWPILADGDLVAVDHSERTASSLNGKMVVFRMNGGATVKWLRYYEKDRMVVGDPENRESKDGMIFLKEKDAYDHIVGRVAWWWSKR